MSVGSDDTGRPRRKRMEIFAFLFLTAVVMPVLAVARGRQLRLRRVDLSDGGRSSRPARRALMQEEASCSTTAIDRRALITGRALTADRVRRAARRRNRQHPGAGTARASRRGRGRDRCAGRLRDPWPRSARQARRRGRGAGCRRARIDAQHHRTAARTSIPLPSSFTPSTPAEPPRRAGRTAMTAPKLDRRQMLKLEAAAIAAARRRNAGAGARRQSRHRARGQRIEMGQGRLPLLRHRLQRHGRRPRTTAWSPPTATSSPRSIAASTASRATSSPRSCTATTG